MTKSIKKLLAPILWGGTGVFFLLLVLSTSMNLVLANREAALGLISAQADDGLTTVLLDEFDGTFHDRAISSNGTFAWGETITPTQGFADTMWCVQGGTGGSTLSAGVDPYPKNVTTTLTYGPLNLNVTAAELDFSYWIETAAGDGLEWGYSPDNTVFTYTVVAPAQMSSWQTLALSNELDSLVGSETAYLSFRFQSNGDDDVGLGVFLDDVRVRIAEEITASFTASAPVCLANSIHFSDTSSATSGIEAVEWNLGDGNTRTDRAFDHTYAAVGTYTVWLTATSQAGSQRVISTSVSVQSVSAGMDITPLYNGNTVCLNTETTFSDNSTLGVPGTAAAWQWTLNGAPASTASGFSHTFTTPGPHTAGLTVTTTAGCADTTSISLNTAAPPAPSLVITGDTDPIETGTTVHLQDQGTGGVFWTWDLGDGTIVTTDTPSIDHVYQRGGPQTVVLTVTATSGCMSVVSETLSVTAKTYMPVVFQNFFTGLEYFTGFGPGESGWPYGDHITLNPDGSKSDEFYFGYKTTSAAPNGSYRSDGKVYYIRAHDDGDHVFVTGPQNKAYTSQNFVYQAVGRTVSSQRRGDEYGILISPVPLDPKHPDSQGLPVYTLQVRLSGDNKAWVFKKWVIENSHDHPADELAKGTTDWLTINTDWFNGFKIERVGNTIHAYVHGASTWGKWKEVASRDMTKDFAKVPDKFYIGLYLAHTQPYSYDFEAQFDNVSVISTPR
ncbi:MAG: PKD domain-containing protein [Anaerolineae bacterium]|nr:PKD domain-containing protein [Anaerolineae bacterium]